MKLLVEAQWIITKRKAQIKASNLIICQMQYTPQDVVFQIDNLAWTMLMMMQSVVASEQSL